jgi:hypothetical protein
MTDVVHGVEVASVTIAIVELLKQTFFLPARFAPIAAIVAAIALELALRVGNGEPFTVNLIVTGLVIGLSAMGLYSGGRTTLSAIRLGKAI